MKILFILTLNISTLTGYSQIVSQLYFGDYPFFNRIIDLNLNQESITRNDVRKVDIKGNLYKEFKIHCIKTFNLQGKIISTKFKNTSFSSKIYSRWYWLTSPLRRHNTLPEITEIDSTNTGQINSIKYNGTIEKYSYNQNGKITKVQLDYQGFSTAPRIKEIYSDYDSDNNVILEKVVWLAGDSTISKHEFQNNFLVKTTWVHYYLEEVQLSDNQFTWRIVDKPKVEIFEYNYLKTGLLDCIRIKDENSIQNRLIKFEYR
jgi:hypothetical protein